MPAIIEFPTIVEEAVNEFGWLFANHPERWHFAEYLTGLLVAVRKNVSGINREFAVTTDQSCLNRWITEVTWDERLLNEHRLAWLQQDPSTRYSPRGVIALDNTLIDHAGQLIEDVGWFWDHADQRHLIAHDYLIANYVCTSGKHYPLEFRRFRKKEGGFARDYGQDDHLGGRTGHRRRKDIGTDQLRTMPMTFNTILEPFTTFVVGSLPRPEWLRQLIEERKRGEISYEEADELIDDAVPMAIRMQERANIDFVSDGEWRRESYVKVFTEHVSGFTLDAKMSVGANVTEPVVSERIEQHSDLATEAAKFLLEHATHRSIVALPSPYILSWRMWKPELSVDAYPTREEFMEACAPIVRDEIRKLTALGVDHVQLDEPWMLMMADPEVRQRIGADDLSGEIDLCVRMMNEVVKDAEIPLSVHLCHGHFNRRRSSDTGYEPIIEALGDIQVGRFAMEFAAPQSHGIEALSKFPKDKVLGLGVIDHCDARVETPEDVVSRAEAALKYVDAERITLNPDCGFSPGAQNPMDMDEAYLKLHALAEGAAILKR